MGNRRIGVTDGRLPAALAIWGRDGCPPNNTATHQRQEHMAERDAAAMDPGDPGVPDELAWQLHRPRSRAPSADAAISSQQKRMTAPPKQAKYSRQSDYKGERGVAGVSPWPCRNLRPPANRLHRVPPRILPSTRSGPVGGADHGAEPSRSGFRPVRWRRECHPERRALPHDVRPRRSDQVEPDRGHASHPRRRRGGGGLTPRQRTSRRGRRDQELRGDARHRPAPAKARFVGRVRNCHAASMLLSTTKASA